MRASAFRAAREAIPLFALYAVLMRDHGLSGGQVATLLIAWSVAGFVFEVPSGAWADMIDRRRLLLVSGLLYTGCFTTWVLWPSYAGFLLGFVLWALSDALMSGTFEALLYDELAACDRTGAWGRLRSVSETAAVLTMAAASLAATPLFAWGGYGLVAWVSVGAAAMSTAFALALPKARMVERESEPGPVVRRYLGTLAEGVREAAGALVLRRAIAAYAAVVPLIGFDEFLPLVLSEGGASTGSLGVLTAAFIAAQAVGTYLADRVSRAGRPAYVVVVVSAGVLTAAGAALPFPLGFAAMSGGYLLATSAMVAGEIRVQHLITGRARATVTSAAGLANEVASMTTFGLVALGSLGWSIATVVAVLAVPFTVAAAMTGVRLPRRAVHERSGGAEREQPALGSGPS
nr:MFS transporter [Luteipulveratus halotolerans]